MPDLDRVHARVVANPWLQLFTAVTRVALAVGFIPPGLTKLLGIRFTALPVTTPVGSFFDAFFQAHDYYVFVGATQVVAVLLLLFPRTTTMGAVLYFPIIINIFVITVSVGFQGTEVVAGLMVLANLYLLGWDYDRWKRLLPLEPAGSRHVTTLVTFSLFIAAFSGFLGLTWLHLAFIRHEAMVLPLTLMFLGAALGMGTVWRHYKMSRYRFSSAGTGSPATQAAICSRDQQ